MRKNKIFLILFLFLWPITALAYPIILKYDWQQDETTITTGKIIAGLQAIKISQYDFIKVKPDQAFKYYSAAMFFGIIVLILLEIFYYKDKVLSGEPITDQERKENPGMWTNAEKYFKFGRTREPINEI